MKKKVVFLCVLLLMSLTFILAQDELTITPTSSSSQTVDTTDTTDTISNTQTTAAESTPLPDSPDLPTLEESETQTSDPKVIINDASNAAKNALNQGLASADESKLLPLPTFLQKPTLFLFSIKDQSEVSLDLFIVLLCLFIALFILLYDVIGAFTEGKLIQCALTGALCCIAGLLGTIYAVSKVLTLMITGSVIHRSIVITLIVVGIILLIFFFKFFIKFFKGMVAESDIEEAEQKGKLLGAFLKVISFRFQKAKRQ